MRTDWRLVAAVAAGGALGSVVRYLLGGFIQDRVSIGLPIGTLLINVLGSLLLGFFMALGLETTAITPEIRFFLTTGFCGGFTTFSTFSYETYRLIEDAEYETAGTYVVASVVLSVLACALGMRAARRLIGGGSPSAGTDRT